jgi:hypothetical protein
MMIANEKVFVRVLAFKYSDCKRSLFKSRVGLTRDFFERTMIMVDKDNRSRENFGCKTKGGLHFTGIFKKGSQVSMVFESSPFLLLQRLVFRFPCILLNTTSLWFLSDSFFSF